MESDAELLARVADGDRRALRVLFERHAGWVTLRLSRRSADLCLVDEAVQDTFVAVWRGAERFRGEGEVGAWIWGIAIRRLIDRLRREPQPSPLSWAAQEHDRVVRSAEDQVLVGVEFGDLAGALNRLSPELRAVVQACVLDGLTTGEAAQLLGVPRGTVKTRMMRARAQLREELT